MNFTFSVLMLNMSEALSLILSMDRAQMACSSMKRSSGLTWLMANKFMEHFPIASNDNKSWIHDMITSS